MDGTALLLFAAGIVVFASVSRPLQKGWFTAPMMFVGLGLVTGPLMLGWMMLDLKNTTVFHGAVSALIVALFTDAVRIDLATLRAVHALPVRLLTLGLPMTMIFGTVVALWLFPGFGLWEAAVLAVILGPTDAALGEPVITSEEVPNAIRQGLNSESGLNDGLGLPALLIVASLATVGNSGSHGAGEWVVYILKQLLGGPFAGLVIGVCALKLLEFSNRRGWVSDDFGKLALFVFPVAAYSAAEIVGANGFIAVFASGVVVSTASDTVRDAVEGFAGTAEQLLNAAVFFLVGAVLLPEFLHQIDWRHVLFALLALTLLRMVPVALSLAGTGLESGTVLFISWFGPRGMASVIYLLIVIRDFKMPMIDDIAATVALTVLISIFAHGMTAAPGSRRYGRYVKDLRQGCPENEAVSPPRFNRALESRLRS